MHVAQLYAWASVHSAVLRSYKEVSDHPVRPGDFEPIARRLMLIAAQVKDVLTALQLIAEGKEPEMRGKLKPIIVGEMRAVDGADGLRSEGQRGP